MARATPHFVALDFNDLRVARYEDGHIELEVWDASEDSWRAVATDDKAVDILDAALAFARRHKRA